MRCERARGGRCAAHCVDCLDEQSRVCDEHDDGLHTHGLRAVRERLGHGALDERPQSRWAPATFSHEVCRWVLGCPVVATDTAEHLSEGGLQRLAADSEQDGPGSGYWWAVHSKEVRQRGTA